MGQVALGPTCFDYCAIVCPIVAHSRVLPDGRRAEILNDALRSAVQDGARIRWHERFRAEVAYGKPINHKLHAILSVCTLSLWAGVWLTLAVSEKTQVVRVDPHGKILKSA